MSEPVEPAPHKGYVERLDKGVLAYQRCDDCRAAVFHPRVTCPGCGSGRLAWRESAGLGTVYATSALVRRDADPYSVALVDLDEGFRMMSSVVGVPADAVRIGMRVRARVEPRDGDREPRPVFVPEEAVPEEARDGS
ncbi:Zn-ribbon domain-containing OB-fold protein [Actinomadura decatromicini]|uniref:DNA-binding protein n=1 Tax=Actinomadura decatromicini TaxID=2604572 RepID=A0A5D3FAN7_9ACTN|nr:OB-fold domain-containing protein [Actinomadura decatromicini]TYK44445.1 hypothetical protein FXF68_33790 [Actinomadura decatromicini]